MSSVGSADKRSQQDEALRRARETYQERDVDQSKKHSQEIKRLNEIHQTELRQMEEAHGRQMDDLRERTREAISTRDMRYQKEIEDLRSMHQNQVRKAAVEAEQKQKLTENTMRQQLDKTTMIKDRQAAEQKAQYESQLGKTQTDFREGLNETRESAQKSIVSQREKLNEAHSKELEAVRGDRDRRLDQAQRDFQSMRTAKDRQLGDLESNKRRSEERLSKAHMESLSNQSAEHSGNLQNAREEFQDGIQNNRSRYEKALQKHTDANSLSSESFRNTIQNRISNEVDSASAENRRLKNELVRQQESLTRQKNREVSNTRSAMGENITQLERDRLEAVRVSNARNAKVVSNVIREKDQQLLSSNREFQDKIESEKTKAKEHIGTTKLQHERELASKELQTMTRETRLKDMNQREEAYLKEFYNESLSANRENFESSLREIREQNKRDQGMIFQNFSKASNERELKFQQKLLEMTQRHQNEVDRLKAEQQTALKNQSVAAEREKKVITEQKNVEMQRQASQFENRIAKLEETHRRELDGLKRRHEESLANMTRLKPKA